MSEDHALARNWRLFYGVLKKNVVLQLRYRLNFAMGVVGLYTMFLVVFFGGRAIAGEGFSDSKVALAVGFLLWTLSVTAYQGLAGDMSTEASWGTLERLYLSPLGFGRVIAFTAVSRVVTSFTMAIVVAVPVALTADISLSFDVLGVFLVALLGVCSVLGLGFAFGAAAIRYKRIGNVVGFLNFGFVGLVAAPVEQVPVLRYFPLAQASHLVQTMVSTGTPLTALPMAELLTALVVAVSYPIAGYLLLSVFIDKAREAGVMDHY